MVVHKLCEKKILSDSLSHLVYIIAYAIKHTTCHESNQAYEATYGINLSMFYQLLRMG